VVGYGTVFCNMGRRGVVGVDVETGKEVWRCREGLAPGGLGSPALAHGLHLQTASGVSNIYAASIRTERVVWEARAPGWSSFITAAVAERPSTGSGRGTVYAGTSHNSPGIAAVDLETGKTLWRAKIEPHLPKEDRRTVYCSPTVGGGRLYIGSDSGWLYALDAENGERLWRFRTGGAVRSSPGLAGDLLYFGSNDGNVYAVEAEAGAERWRFETGGPVRSSPWLGDGVLYVGSQDGSLYALE
jgi:outer membrane protein assembly factor BamB